MSRPRPVAEDPVADIERELAGFLRRAWRVRELHMGGRIVRLDISGYVLLIRLAEEGPARSGELARHFGLDKSTVSRQTRALERAGLLQRIEDPADGRAALIDLSPAGRDSLQKSRAARREVLVDLLARWDVGDQRDLARLLARFNADAGANRVAARPDRETS